jgi:hypothetical protein
MALLQCMDFLKKYPHMLVEDKDTAETAEESKKTVERELQQSPVKQLH